jgi:hypothetical protein
MSKELYIWSKSGQVLLLLLFLLTSGTFGMISTNVNSIFPSANAQFNLIANNPFGAPFGISAPPVSFWFPSVPAIACGGLFSLTITGKPHLNVNVHGSSNSNKELLALSVTSTPLPSQFGLFGQSQSSVDGTISQGKKNIEHNRLHDFDVKNVFNNCRMLVFSKSKNPHITTPVPTMTNGIVTDTGLLASGGLNPVLTCPIGYQRDIYGNCVQVSIQ